MGILAGVILLILVITLSFSLNSISSYRRKVRRSVGYSTFLVRSPQGLDLPMLEKIYDLFKRSGFDFSLEKLFKGQKEALVIFAPGFLVRPMSLPLDLLEIEDYSQPMIKKPDLESPKGSILPLHIETVVFESGLMQLVYKYIQDIQIKEDEQIWWQLVLRPKPKNLLFNFNLSFLKKGIPSQKNLKRSSLTFGCYFNLRLVIQTASSARTNELYQQFAQSVETLGIHLYPQVHSKFQIASFYRDRLLILESWVKFFHRKSFHPDETYRKVDKALLIKSDEAIDLKQVQEFIGNIKA